MEDGESSSAPSAVIVVPDGAIKRIKLTIASEKEICTYSVNDCPVTHQSQLGNPFLGLPLELGKCESCGTAEIGKCEGHFGFIELPVPVYHPSHISELRQILSMVCLKCLRLKKGKVKRNGGKESFSSLSCYNCRDLPSISIKEVKKLDGALQLQLRTTLKKLLPNGLWKFLDRYGFHHGDNSNFRLLLPSEALNILKALSEDTRKKLASRGYVPQIGYVMTHLPVPPNCLYVPEISDGRTVMSHDISMTMLKKLVHRIEQIKKSRTGSPNFDSHEVESSDLQIAIAQYMHLRGTTRGPQDLTKRFAVGPEATHLSTKQWLEKMRTLFISKGSGFSSRSVITGDPYIRIDVVGLPSEIAKRMTFEEQVTDHNIYRLQKVVDDGQCVTYRDGPVTYAISVGSKGHTTLKVGQTVNRIIADGDIVFLNRPPSTHKHSLQAFFVYIHDDHTVKLNPLICDPLGADFDGDCVHIFYPQSPAAKAEALELFSVEQQLMSSHSGSLNLKFVQDSLLGLKFMCTKVLLKKELAQQLAMYVSPSLPLPAVVKPGLSWTIGQILQCALPNSFSSCGDKHFIQNSEMIKLDVDRESVNASLSEMISAILALKGPKDALQFLNNLQPLLMELVLLDGFSISLRDFDVPADILKVIQKNIQKHAFMLEQSRQTSNQLVDLRVENHLKIIRQPVIDFMVKHSALGSLIDPKSDSSAAKVVQQLGFLGLQLHRYGKLYSSTLVQDCISSYANRFSGDEKEHPSEAYGLVRSSFFHGLNPFDAFVHAIGSREVIVRSSRGLTEPGTLFKNLMAILRDVVICYDGSVRNICSNSIVQFEYMETDKKEFLPLSPPGEPVGVLAATAISNPAYKAVLDSSLSNTTSWELMKEILLTRTNYKNDNKDRKIILFLNDCFCGKKFCKERAALKVQSCLKKVKLEDCTTEFFVEYNKQGSLDGTTEKSSGLVGHIHLDKVLLGQLDITVHDILQKCQDIVAATNKKKSRPSMLKSVNLTASECCCAEYSGDGKTSRLSCLQFTLSEGNNSAISDEPISKAVNIFANSVCPFLLETIIKGDPRIQETKVVWVGSDATSWVKNSRKPSKGEPAVEIVIERDSALHTGDAWRTAMDACIPVINLIDTGRSIPYGIQQVQELLGISCSFDQVIQRLSTTIRIVSKDVLKDHLILVANSMTCTGILNGFNTAGYRAVFRSLKVQVPFTESTLFTPMKCFEKAAEKCHSDSLNCVVSSCSWGKNAAIGTGSSFQILWDEKQLAPNKELGDGLYDFLALIRTAPTGENPSFVYMDDVDYLMEENYMEDGCASPEVDGGAGLTFDEDNTEPFSFAVPNNDGWGISEGDNSGGDKNSIWDTGKATANGTKSDSWGGWSNAKAAPAMAEQEELDSWNAKAVAKADEPDGWGGWDARKKENSSEPSILGKPPFVQHDSDNWGRSNGGPGNDNDSWGKPSTTATESDGWGNSGRANASKMDVDSDSWGKPQTRKVMRQTDHDSWIKPKPDLNKSWQEDKEEDSWAQTTKVDGQNPWHGSKTIATNDQSSWGNSMVSSQEKNNAQKDSDPWGKTAAAPARGNADDNEWKTQKQTSWDPKPDKGGDQNSWDSKPASASSLENDLGSQWNANATKIDQNAWGSNPASALENSTDGQWNTNQGANQSSDAWGGKPASSLKNNSDSQWNANQSSDDGGGWNARAWSAGNSAGNAETEGSTKWNDGAGSERKKVWKTEGGWGQRRGGPRNNADSGRPPRPPRPADQRSGPRKPSEPLTPEEEKILVEVEPIVQRIRKIVRESCDGVKLAPDDEKFILESVLEHHPDKQTKVSGQVDYIMVAKHQVFQDSRCFHVVSSDGSNSDFSYLKCMENFVRKSFPDHADTFCTKYFRKSGRREATPAPEADVEKLPPGMGSEAGGTQAPASDWGGASSSIPAGDWGGASSFAPDSGWGTLSSAPASAPAGEWGTTMPAPALAADWGTASSADGGNANSSDWA